MGFKATMLCENSVLGIQGCVAQHGLSVFLETDQGNYLIDTGPDGNIINNARVLKLDLNSIKGIILSHHHYDHTGGLLDVLLARGDVDVYAHPELFKHSFKLQKEGKERYIGIPFRQELLENKGARFIFSRNWQEIAPDIFLTGEVPRMTSYEKGDKSQVIKGEKGFIQDQILDDQAVVCKTEQGLFIILGCSHSGMINILNYAIKMTGEERIHTVIGGTHLGLLPPEIMEKSIEDLHKFSIQRLGVSHCTGLKASARLSREFGDKFFFCTLGTVVEV